MSNKKVCLVIGAGDATGGAVAKRFASEGYVACVTRRTLDKLQPLLDDIHKAGGVAHGFGSDARKEDEVIALIDHIESSIGPIDVLVFNIGANSPNSILTETARRYTKMWEMACLAGFLNGREVAKRMVSREKDTDQETSGISHRGTIIFTGATASLRGSANFAGFSGGKMALRGLAQSMARELGPLGIHVAHTIIDGAIDTEFIRTLFPDKYALKEQGGILNPDHIADAYWMLHQQPRDAWTHELAKTFDYFFDFGSLAAYLAHTQMDKIKAETGAQPIYLPMLLGAVFKATGNVSPVSVPAKGKYIFVDFKRFADNYGVPLNNNPFFPIITTTLMRILTGLQMRSDARMHEFMDVIFKAIWVDALNLNDPEVVERVLQEAHFDASALLQLANAPEAKDRLRDVTTQAVERGVFGAPTFFVGDQMFWGQDRIEQLKAALKT